MLVIDFLLVTESVVCLSKFKASSLTMNPLFMTVKIWFDNATRQLIPVSFAKRICVDSVFVLITGRSLMYSR
jgi:hypothetical protein